MGNASTAGFTESNANGGNGYDRSVTVFDKNEWSFEYKRYLLTK